MRRFGSNALKAAAVAMAVFATGSARHANDHAIDIPRSATIPDDASAGLSPIEL